MEESNREKIERVLLRVQRDQLEEMETGAALFEDHCVKARTYNLPESILEFRLDKPEEALEIAKMSKEDCSLTKNGLQGGHEILLLHEYSLLVCPRHCCSFKACPFAIAACFQLLLDEVVAITPEFARMKRVIE